MFVYAIFTFMSIAVKADEVKDLIEAELVQVQRHCEASFNSFYDEPGFVEICIQNKIERLKNGDPVGAVLGNLSNEQYEQLNSAETKDFRECMKKEHPLYGDREKCFKETGSRTDASYCFDCQNQRYSNKDWDEVGNSFREIEQELKFINGRLQKFNPQL